MRRMFLAGLVLVVTLATISVQAQVWVTNTGFASDRMLWGVPNSLRITTPVIDLQTTSPAAVGATNGTSGNIAGASNATLANVAVGSSATITPAMMVASPSAAEPESPPQETAAHQALNLGAASFESAYDFPWLGNQSLAQVAARTRERTKSHPAKKMFTNDDVARVKQQQEQQENPQPPANPPPNH